jgi:hypothetical protein
MKRISNFFKDKELAYSVALLFLIWLAVYRIAVNIAPSDEDDLMVWTSMKNASCGWEFFFKPWGLGWLPYYRPLHSSVMWVIYHFFGIAPKLNQFINIAMQFINTLLLFKLVRLFQKDTVISFLLSALFLISMYSFSTTDSIQGRTNLLVAMFLLILLNYLFKVKRERRRFWIPLALSILAALSKENGLIVPMFWGFFEVFESRESLARRTRHVILPLAVMMGYIIARKLAVPHGGSIVASSEFFGQVTPIRNIARLIVAAFVPIWGDYTVLLLQPGHILLIVVPTATLTVAALVRGISKTQIYMLVLIAFNALVHYVTWGIRFEYLALIAICILLADTKPSWKWSIPLLFILVSGNLYEAAKGVPARYRFNYEDLHYLHLKPELERQGKYIDPGIVEECLKWDRNEFTNP